MDVHIDRSDVYTSGEWVRGSVVLGSEMSGVRDIIVELSGVQTIRTFATGQTIQDTKTLYKVTKRIDAVAALTTLSKRANRSFDFAIQFPGHDGDNYMKVPASFAVPDYEPRLEVCHMVSIRVDKGKLFSRIVEKVVELRFMPSEDIALLLEPNIEHYEESLNGLPLAAVVSIPRYHAMGEISNRLSIKLLDEENRFKCEALTHLLEFKSSFMPESFYSAVRGGIQEPTDEYTIEYVFDHPITHSPGSSFCGTSVSYNFVIVLFILDKVSGVRHEIRLRYETEILPTIFYKHSHDDIATPDEISTISERRKNGF